MTDQLDISARTCFAAACAYHIHAKGVDIPTTAPVSQTMPSAESTYFYEVVPEFQSPVGFLLESSHPAPAFYATGDDLIHAALAGVTEDGYAIIALRGTIAPSFKDNDLREWVWDWANDGDAAPLDWAPYGQTWGRVATGFGNGAYRLWAWLEAMLTGMIDKAPKGILVCGHSKGAAMTFPVASLIATRWPELKNKVQVHAFAAPVTADKAFADAYQAAGLAQNSHRYQVEHDMVPFLPIWNGADVWEAIRLPKLAEEIAWRAFVTAIRKGCLDGGYYALGSFSFFDAGHQKVTQATPSQNAMPPLVELIETGKFSAIVGAHNITDNYLPCVAPADALPRSVTAVS